MKCSLLWLSVWPILGTSVVVENVRSIAREAGVALLYFGEIICLCSRESGVLWGWWYVSMKNNKRF